MLVFAWPRVQKLVPTNIRTIPANGYITSGNTSSQYCVRGKGDLLSGDCILYDARSENDINGTQAIRFLPRQFLRHKEDNW